MNLSFCNLKEDQKTWTQFVAVLKKLKKHELNFCELKKSKIMDLI